MLLQEQGADGEALLRIEGHVDASSAQEVKAFLQGTRRATTILDFTHAREVDYYALAAVAAVLIQTDKRVAMRGLCDHHVRMLGYFGLDPGRFGIPERR